MAEASQTGMSWQQGVESSLHHYRTVFTDKSVLLSLLEEIHTLVEEVKSTINTKMFGFDNEILQNGKISYISWNKPIIGTDDQNLLQAFLSIWWHPLHSNLQFLTCLFQQPLRVFLSFWCYIALRNQNSFKKLSTGISFRQSNTPNYFPTCAYCKRQIFFLLNMIHKQSTFMHRRKVFADI